MTIAYPRAAARSEVCGVLFKMRPADVFVVFCGLPCQRGRKLVRYARLQIRNVRCR